MTIGASFKEFVEYLQDIEMEDKKKRMERITKKLNKTYYENNQSKEEHFLLVGSLGRHTAIRGVSDVDMGFVFPDEIYNKYHKREHNGQSDLLQDVKKTLSELAPRTIVRGDGQVVVLEFNDYVVELCPFFYKDENSYVYPNSNHGGKWQTTKPIPEITESEILIDATNGHFQSVCNIIRAWKNEQGFKFGGLLIDTLVCKFFHTHRYNEADYSDYPQLLKDFFSYLKDLNKEQNYWFALGSKQKVYNKDGKFVAKARQAFNKIKDLNNESEEMKQKMKELFGNTFPGALEERVAKSLLESHGATDTEEFINQKYNVDIRYSMEIKCDVSQAGWRKTPLKHLSLLKADKTLDFFVEVPEDIKEPYDIKWKVRNIGELAYQKDEIRGQIINSRNDKHTHTEQTKFAGPHYVEAYIIKNNTVVAKDRIDVPINITNKGA